MSTVTIKLNGASYTVEAGSTILEAAASVGVRIPSLCYLKDQEVKANCRVCLVEVKGSRTLQPACAVKVSEGMEIQTDTPEVHEARRTSLQLILSHHPIDCQSCVRLESSHLEDLSKELCSMCFYCDCVRDGDCELQKLVEEYNINHLDFPWEQKQLKEDHSAPSIVKNPNKCILCRRCVEACSGQGIGVWHVAGRGNKAQITTAFNRPLAATDCVECGQCVRSCPVGALYESQDYQSSFSALFFGAVLCGRSWAGWLLSCSSTDFFFSRCAASAKSIKEMDIPALTCASRSAMVGCLGPLLIMPSIIP